MTDGRKYSHDTVEILKEITRLTTVNDQMREKVNEIHACSRKQWDLIDDHAHRLITIESNIESDRRWHRAILAALTLLTGGIGTIIVKLIKHL